MLRCDPIGAGQGLSVGILRQIFMFEVDTLEYGRETPRYATRLPSATFETLRLSRAAAVAATMRAPSP